jgi:carbon-monoxide dehydrogenase medium subunit
MYSSDFSYHRAGSVDDALGLLRQYGDDARLLAGGHSLLPMMKLRLATPRHLVDIGRIDGLAGIAADGGTIRIGALTRHADLAASTVAGVPPVLTQAARLIGDVQVRNRGTIGGSVAHADPGADLPAAILALDGEIIVAGERGERAIAAADFFTDAFATALGPGEMVVAVRVPASRPDQRDGYDKFADPASSYSIVSAAAVLRVSGGKIAEGRVAVTGLYAGRAMRLPAVESALRNQPATAASATAAAAKAAEGLDLYDDSRATAAYKANLVRVHVGRAITRALT